MFNNRKLVIATKHEKELVIAPLLEGLPCSYCGNETRSILSYIYACQKCSYINEDMYPNKKTTEDPIYCDVCNP
jgi:hypothetical protein